MPDTCRFCPNPTGGTTLCSVHAERHKEYKSERSARLAESGLCDECGQRPRGPYTRCLSCRLKHADAAKERRRGG